MAAIKQYTYEDRLGVAELVSKLVGHPVACRARFGGGISGGKKGDDAYQIQPLSGWSLKEFWCYSDYGKTRQYWPSPIEAGIHYAKHYLAFVGRDLSDLTEKIDTSIVINTVGLSSPLSSTQQRLYDALSHEITTKDAVQIAQQLTPPVSERTTKSILMNTSLFERITHGHYRKANPNK